MCAKNYLNKILNKIIVCTQINLKNKILTVKMERHKTQNDSFVKDLP